MKEVTQEQINEWKGKFGSVYVVEVEDKKAYLKAPGRNELSYAGTVGGKDPMKFNELILNACWIEGDEEIKTVERLFLGVISQLDQIIETAEATIKKL